MLSSPYLFAVSRRIRHRYNPACTSGMTPQCLSVVNERINNNSYTESLDSWVGVASGQRGEADVYMAITHGQD